MEIKCVLEKRETKDGKPYMVIYIPDLEKVVFLTQTEVKLLTLLYKVEK